MDSFAWASVSQTAGLAGGSTVVSDERGRGLLPPPMLGLQLPPPAGLEHFMDPGLVQLAMRSSCFAAANGAPTASPSYITSEKHPLQATTGTGSGNGGVYDDAPSAEACSSKAPEPDSNSKTKRKRSNEDVLGMIGTDQDQGMASNASVDSSNERGEDDDAKGKEETPPVTRKKKGKGATSAADDESYIHVRARKGQVTNRHSLAERLRREKISERMKLLQDIVPGCTKVTGKAVMLDEIINYVQSLQRQVEFLSRKLAAVNPHLGLNIKQLLSKDLFRAPSAPSSSTTHLGFSFSHEMMPKLPPLSRSGMVLGGVHHGLTNSDGFRTAMEEQLNGKDCCIGDHVSQMPLTLDGSFHNAAAQTVAYEAIVGPEHHLGMRSIQDGFHM